jgi:hypothetical protein
LDGVRAVAETKLIGQRGRAGLTVAQGEPITFSRLL